MDTDIYLCSLGHGLRLHRCTLREALRVCPSDTLRVGGACALRLRSSLGRETLLQRCLTASGVYIGGLISKKMTACKSSTISKSVLLINLTGSAMHQRVTINKRLHIISITAANDATDGVSGGNTGTQNLHLTTEDACIG